MIWTQAEEDKAKRLYVDEGMGTTAVARIMGMTRNMVGAKLKRLGVLRAATSRTERTRKPAQARFKPGLVPTPPSLPPEPAPLAKPPTPIRNGFLLPHHCKFPSGDPATEEFRFCGGVREPDWPYCKAHNAISYNIPPRKTA